MRGWRVLLLLGTLPAAAAFAWQPPTALTRTGALGHRGLSAAWWWGRLRGCAVGARMEIDVGKARADTRGCGEGMGVHLNNAGAALMPKVVADIQRAIVDEEETMGGYEAAAARKEDTEAFYTEAAALLNCSPDEVAFVDSATRAWTLAFHSLPLKSGDRVITHASDYGSNFVTYLQAKQRVGIELVIVPDDESGAIDVAALRREAAHPRTTAVCLCHVPTGGGLVNPAAEVAEVARGVGAWYLLDACQSVGQLRVDVGALGCDVLAAAGRKYLRGPRGTGLLFASRRFLDACEASVLDQFGAPMVDEGTYEQRTDSRRFEMWEYSTAGKAGLAAAMRYCNSVGIGAIEARVCALAARARAGLGGVARVTDTGREKCGIVTFLVGGVACGEVAKRLAARGVRVSVSSAGGGSRVWFDRRGLVEVVRASFHYYNTEEEVDTLVAEVAAIAATPESGVAGP